MTAVKIGPDVFEVHQEMIEVTSLHRPDTNWRYVDPHGHEHRWQIKIDVNAVMPTTTDGPFYISATHYDPKMQYFTPSLIRVHDGWAADEDSEYELWHLACAQCGATVKPGYIADDTVQYIPGLKRCRINGESVSKEEFDRRLDAAMKEIP